MFYLIPPAGTPIAQDEIIGALFSARHLNGDNSFARKIMESFSVNHCFTYNSGRTALYYLLKVFFELREKQRDEVVIPAYTCFSVASAIARAGLKIRLVDIDPHTLDFKLEQLAKIDRNRTLAVIGCNLFGIINDWNIISEIIFDKEIFMIDDAAQSMGVVHQGRLSGTNGDAGLFSLGRGKNVSTYSGGILIINNDEIAHEIGKSARALKKSGTIMELAALAKIWLYSIFLNPRFYWLPELIPFLGLGKTVFDENFRVGKLTNIQSALGTHLIDKLERLNHQRQKNSKELAEELVKSGRFEIPGYDTVKCPAYLRLPLLVENRAERDRLIKRLRKSGIVASIMYPSTIRSIPGIDKYLADEQTEFPGAQLIVDRMLTIPTHGYLKDRDIQQIIACLLGK